MSAATLRHFRYVVGENPVTLAAFLLFTGFVLLALLGPWLAPYPPLASDTQAALQPPSMRHWFGTDSLGRDILSRIVVATRLDFGIAVSAVAASFAIGASLGALAGFYVGWVDRIVGRISDTIMAFPLFVLAMGIVAALGNTVANIVLATAIINLPFYIRLARAEVNVRRNAGYVEAARLAGNNGLQALARHVFPNILPPMMVQISLNMGWAILNAAGLSFIGLGVRPPQAEWGIMVAEGATYIISGEWWVALFPGAVLMLAVFTFNLLGDGLRDLLDPRMRT
jgi:peptide/nickel transport system permease protein